MEEKGEFKNALHILYRDDFKNDEFFNGLLEGPGVERPCEVDSLTIWATPQRVESF